MSSASNNLEKRVFTRGQWKRYEWKRRSRLKSYNALNTPIQFDGCADKGKYSFTKRLFQNFKSFFKKLFKGK